MAFSYYKWKIYRVNTTEMFVEIQPLFSPPASGCEYVGPAMLVYGAYKKAGMFPPFQIRNFQSIGWLIHIIKVDSEFFPLSLGFFLGFLDFLF